MDAPHLSVKILRELLRNLMAFRAEFEASGLEVLRWHDQEFCLWDIEYLYRQISVLSPRQRQAIELCLVRNVREKDAALIMGVSETNPVMMYATDGLKRLCDMIESGELSRYQPDAEMAVAQVARILRGVHLPLEAEADRLIKESLAGITRHADKSDILTPWKDQARREREVYSASGVPDSSTRLGMFNRAYNPERSDLNSRDGIARASRSNRSFRSLSDWYDDHQDTGDE